MLLHGGAGINIGQGLDNLHPKVYNNILVVFNPWIADYPFLIANPN
jgi:hypothetical protein